MSYKQFVLIHLFIEVKSTIFLNLVLNLIDKFNMSVNLIEKYIKLIYLKKNIINLPRLEFQ